MTHPPLLLSALIAGLMGLMPMERPPDPPAWSQQPMVLQCSEAATAGRLLRMVLGAGPLRLLGSSPAASLLPVLVDADAAQRAGIDLAAPLALRFGPQAQGELRLGMQQGLSLADLDRAALGLVDLETQGWTMALEGGQLTLTSAQPPAPAAAMTPAEGPGCQLLAVVGADAGDRLRVFIPKDRSQPMRVQAQSPRRIPPLLMERPVEPFSGSSVSPPDLVLTLGLSPEILLDALHEVGAPALPALAFAGWSGLTDGVEIGGGTTFALWMKPEGPRFALSLPILREGGRPLPVRAARRRLAASLSQKGLEVERLGPDRLSVHRRGAGMPLLVVVQPDRLLVGDEAKAVADSAEGRGPAWVDETLAELARSAPLALQSNLELAQVGGVAPHAPLRLGVQVRGAEIELLVLADDAALVPQLLGLGQLKGRLDRRRPR